LQALEKPLEDKQAVREPTKRRSLFCQKAFSNTLPRFDSYAGLLILAMMRF